MLLYDKVEVQHRYAHPHCSWQYRRSSANKLRFSHRLASPKCLAHGLNSCLKIDSMHQQVQSAGLDMTFLSDVVSVAFVSDLITWSSSDAVLSQLTDPAMGVYLCGAPLLDQQLVTFTCTAKTPVCIHICMQCVSICVGPDAGHSRGGKVSVLTASLDDRVTALCLLDPVDNTKCAAVLCNSASCVAVAFLFPSICCQFRQ